MLFLAFAACDAPPVKSPGPSAIILVLDGVRVDELTGTGTSDLTGKTGEDEADATWAALSGGAAIVRQGLNDGVTTTGPAHAAMLTGAMQPLANLPVDAVAGPAWYRTERPTIFEEIRSQLDLPESGALLVGNTGFVTPYAWSNAPGFGPAFAATCQFVGDAEDPSQPSLDDADVFAAIETAISAGPPRLIVANLHEADRAAHYETDTDYARAVEHQDQLVSEFWTWLSDHQPDYAADLLLFVTADHGRHDHELDGGWHNHGDSCDGCRAVPLFLIGGGATAGVTDEGDYTTEDLAPTIAAHLGIDLPWAEGLPLSRLFDGAEMPARSGVRDVARSGSLDAESVFLDGYEARSQVELEGAVFSTPGALHAEEPVVLDGDAFDALCFREQVLDPEAATQPWTPRCFADSGSGWTDIGFPVDAVDAFWRPLLEEHLGKLRVAWVHNPDFSVRDRLDNAIGVRAAAWDAQNGWVDVANWSAVVPTGLSRSGDWLAWSASADELTARYTRRVRVAKVGGQPVILPGQDDLGDSVRVEAPAIRVEGDRIDVAYLATAGEGWRLFDQESVDGGLTWQPALEQRTKGEPLLSPRPVWVGGEVLWFDVVDGATEACMVSPEGGTGVCQSLGDRVRSVAVTGDGLVRWVQDGGAGAWEAYQVPELVP